MSEKTLRVRLGILKIGLLSVMAAILVACSAGQDRIPLILSVPTRSMSKLPFVIAEDQGLYEKHGLDVELWLGEPEFEGGVETTRLGFWRSMGMFLHLQGAPEHDIYTDGQTPQMVRRMTDPQTPQLLALAATDCSVRYYVIGRPGLKSLEELKGQRLGIGNEGSTPGFAGLRVVQRMGWDRTRDISIITKRGGMELLRKGEVDAVVGGDDDFEAAQKEGFPVLEDTRVWNEELAGNSILVSPEWLQDETHREAARRFLMATAEAVALYHQRPEVALDVMVRWYGMPREIAEDRYKRTDYIPRKPFPCVDGVKKTMELYDSEEMRKYKPEDFYDDSFMRELDQSGFLDSLYN